MNKRKCLVGFAIGLGLFLIPAISQAGKDAEGQTFSVGFQGFEEPNPVTGDYGFSVPINLPPGINGFQPSVSLNYQSGGPNSAIGVGWSLPLDCT